ncbi:MAG TPA: hypothetical protein VGC47_11375 [Acidimicrobiia bacterium]|jgi:hypothetical protein
MDRDRLVKLIESSDLDGLVRFTDGLVAAQEWAGLVELRERCMEANERGKQVWGAAHFAEYRLALHSPPPYCVDVLRPNAGRFALGPLWEVAASTHTWAELSGVDDARLRTLIGHERAIRGDQVPSEVADRHVVDAPLGLEKWEPPYPVAVYRSDKADFPELDHPTLAWVELPVEHAAEAVESAAVEALLDLVRPWMEESNGRAEAVCVEGNHLDAIRELGPGRVRIARVDPARALGAMVWAGASGGAHGRRRGTPVGRGLAWFALGALLGLEDDWPVEGDELGDGLAELEWHLWDPGDQAGGWGFHLAVVDPEDALAWAVTAVDAP